MQKYCESVSQTLRRPTRQVLVGNIGVGGANPIRIQSMTTSNTRDVEATVEQVIRLADAGCEIVRMTVQGMKEADACEQIKSRLIQLGYHTPLVADIHFYPPAAMRVIDFVEKVRINPGNYADKRASFKTLTYDDASYAEELVKIEEKLVPLIEKCKKLKRAMRIGTNHGSLSDRIMNRYGDTPKGMVESALEFARICRKYDYHDLIFSMKSSNPQVMVLAYRLLAKEMYALNWDYPLHLGVTEAGLGEDGRIKSAMGIGALLLDGLGDTIRVSLTEDPWHEIEPCQKLIQLASHYQNLQPITPFVETARDWQQITRRLVDYPNQISMHRSGTVGLKVNQAQLLNNPEQAVGYTKKEEDIQLKNTTADLLFLEEFSQYSSVESLLNQLKQVGLTSLSYQDSFSTQPIEVLNKVKTSTFNPQLFKLPFCYEMQKSNRVVEVEFEQDWDLLKQNRPDLIIFKAHGAKVQKARKFFNWLQHHQLTVPVILHFSYSDISLDEVAMQAAAELGSLLCDGLGEGIVIDSLHPPAYRRELSFSILQAARMRMVKTDFISCPSCGRTLFDLQEVTKRIKERTAHLPGVKIAIMGCIVNGPGEMADADFGYVGSRPGMIDLYRGKECVEKNIAFAEADDRLIELIKKEGYWVEPILTL